MAYEPKPAMATSLAAILLTAIAAAASHAQAGNVERANLVDRSTHAGGEPCWV